VGSLATRKRLRIGIGMVPWDEAMHCIAEAYDLPFEYPGRGLI
jgi:hypothetical protein